MSQIGDWQASGRRPVAVAQKALSQPARPRATSRPRNRAEGGEHDQRPHPAAGSATSRRPPAVPRAALRRRSRTCAAGKGAAFGQAVLRPPISLRSITLDERAGDASTTDSDHHRLPGPAGHVVDGKRTVAGSRMSSTGTCASRRQGHCPISARNARVKMRVRATPPLCRMYCLAASPASTPASFRAVYASTVTDRSAGPSNQIDHVPSARCRASSSFASSRSVSASRRPRK